MSLVNVYKKLKDKYPNNEIIVTLENMGAMYTFNNEIKVMPSIKVTQVDPSCSGDVFHGAFAYCLANNFDIEKAVTYSNIAAGLSVTKMGGQTSIPTIKEVINYYNQKFNIKTPVVEEKPKEEVKPVGDTLPEIPDAANFTITPPTSDSSINDIGASFFGSAASNVATPETTTVPVNNPTPNATQPVNQVMVNPNNVQ